MIQNAEKCLDLLIKLGANINVQADNGRTPLHLSAVYGRFGGAQTLLNNGNIFCTLL